MADIPILTPRTREELVDHVRAAARDRAPLFVTGSANVPEDIRGSVRVLSTAGLDRVVAHEVGDLTLTAECGLTVGRAQDLLGRHGQFLAFDAPMSTIGGVIASGRDGPLASRFGLVRDQVLGLTVVNGDGRVTHCGGRVVKNVTGYDLCRLYTGSKGSLGIIVEATVRVRPLPECARRFDFVLPDLVDAFRRAFEIRRTIPEIASILITRGETPDRFVLSAFAAGLGAFVEAVAGESESAVGARADESTEWDPRRPIGAAPDGPAIVLVSALPLSWPAFLADLDALLSPAIGWTHDILRGVRTSWHPTHRPLFQDERKLNALLSGVGATLDCPLDPAFHSTLAARFPSQVPGGLALMKSLKAALDPAAVLNPGMTVYE